VHVQFWRFSPSTLVSVTVRICSWLLIHPQFDHKVAVKQTLLKLHVVILNVKYLTHSTIRSIFNGISSKYMGPTLSIPDRKIEKQVAS